MGISISWIQTFYFTFFRAMKRKPIPSIKNRFTFHLLPKEISSTSSTNTDRIVYFYIATGKKWLKRYFGPGSVDVLYAGNFVYKDYGKSDGFVLDYIINSEGFIEMTETTLDSYQYFLRDHLGNTRVMFDDQGTVEQTADYYPFGMQHAGGQGGDNKYLYNGKEIQDEELNGVGLDWYDYGARFYDPALGRFHTQDRFAEDFSSWSPYHYANNNPILFIDINGDSTYTYNVSTGELTMIDETGGNETQIVNFVNEDGTAYTKDGDPVTAAIEGESVFVSEASDGFLVSTYNPVEGLPENYNSESGYEYSTKDLILRHKLKGSILGKAIARDEMAGNARPICSQNFYDQYVQKYGTDKALWFGLEEGYYGNILPGMPNAIPTKQPTGNFSLPSYKSTSPISNSWNRYLHANRGSGKSIQQLAEEYNKLMKGK